MPLWPLTFRCRGASDVDAVYEVFKGVYLHRATVAANMQV